MCHSNTAQARFVYEIVRQLVQLVSTPNCVSYDGIADTKSFRLCNAQWATTYPSERAEITTPINVLIAAEAGLAIRRAATVTHALIHKRFGPETQAPDFAIFGDELRREHEFFDDDLHFRFN